MVVKKPSGLPDNYTSPSSSDGQEWDDAKASHTLGSGEREDLVVSGSAGSYHGHDEDGGQKLSANAIICLAGERFIQTRCHRVDDVSVLSHPYANSCPGLSAEDTMDVDLVGYLLAAADKVDQQQFDCASELLSHCCSLCSNKGNPVQRLVHYFSLALQEKVNQVTGRITSKGIAKVPSACEEAVMGPSPSIISLHQKLPFSQVSQYAGVQAIVENVAGAKKVHMIDLAIMSGCSCEALMQTLAARRQCPLEHLKVTAVGTKLMKNLEETGRQLVVLAQSINLPFSFHVVVVEDMLNLAESHFELDSEEILVIRSSYLFSTMLTRPDRLDHLMKVIRNLHPSIMVINMVEVNLNSPVFVNRFVEALFLEGAYFDSLEDCMDHGDPDRAFVESRYLYEEIKSYVAVDGAVRSNRHVNFNVWRKFFSRLGMVLLDLSPSTLDQACLVVKKVPCWSPCTIDINEKGLIIGWKGTPLLSFSVWKFL